MESKLVYRSLRQISQWTVDGFYDKVHVCGEENVPETGPLIVTPCHHNEILDIATLAATMPHRRPVCFWAKSSMFANPVAKAIMTSSGSIPVRRNPNGGSTYDGNGNAKDRVVDGQFALFRETFRALDKGEVVGVFPEGTSYTEPQIAQVKEGTAWAALEYARWQIQHASEYPEYGSKKLVIVPVGIVYTDKTRFQSEIFVRYGKPIDVEPYARRHLASNDPRVEVKKLTAELEKRLVKLTINAPDWDHHFAGTVAREIALPSTKMQDDYVESSQAIMNCIGDVPDVSSLIPLITYAGLLHHTHISHRALASLYPTPALPSRDASLATFLHTTIATIVQPRFLAFLPVGLLHVPAYAVGALAGRVLADPREPETVAEHKAVCAGLAFGATSAFAGWKVAGTVYEQLFVAVQDGRLDWLPESLKRACAWVCDLSQESAAAVFVRLFGTAAVIYWTTWALFRWHKALIRWNNERYLLIRAAWTVMVGVWLPPSRTVPPALANRPPLPKPNPYIKRRVDLTGAAAASTTDTEDIHGPTPPPRALIAHLFSARAEAEAATQKLLSARHAPSP